MGGKSRMKDFFNNITVKIIAWVLWLISTVVLILGGVSAEGISSVLTATVGIIAGISALIVLIGSLIKKKE